MNLQGFDDPIFQIPNVPSDRAAAVQQLRSAGYIPVAYYPADRTFTVITHPLRQFSIPPLEDLPNASRIHVAPARYFLNLDLEARHSPWAAAMADGMPAWNARENTTPAALSGFVRPMVDALSALGLSPFIESQEAVLKGIFYSVEESRSPPFYPVNSQRPAVFSRRNNASDWLYRAPCVATVSIRSLAAYAMRAIPGGLVASLRCLICPGQRSSLFGLEFQGWEFATPHHPETDFARSFERHHRHPGMAHEWCKRPLLLETDPEHTEIMTFATPESALRLKRAWLAAHPEPVDRLPSDRDLIGFAVQMKPFAKPADAEKWAPYFDPGRVNLTARDPEIQPVPIVIDLPRAKPARIKGTLADKAAYLIPPAERTAYMVWALESRDAEFEALNRLALRVSGLDIDASPIEEHLVASLAPPVHRPEPSSEFLADSFVL